MKNKLGFLFDYNGWKCGNCGKTKAIKDNPDDCCPNCGEYYYYFTGETRLEYNQYINSYITKYGG